MAPSPALSRPAHSPHFTAATTTTTTKKAALFNKCSRLELEESMQSLEDYSLRERRREDRQAHYNSLVSLCISNKALREGLRLRSHMAHVGHEPGLFMDNQFINLYAKCGEVDRARQLFDCMPQRNAVSWNALIAGYCSGGHFLDALRLFRDMTETGPSPNYLTYLGAVRASTGRRDLEFGKQLHGRVVKEDLRSLIAANIRNSCGEGALAVFVEMQEAGFVPSGFTFGSLLGSREVTLVEELHAQVTKRGLGSDVFTGTALLDAYARQGEPRAACAVFDSMPERNTVAWNAVMDACFGNNIVDVGLELFLQMGERGMLPDEYTISILLKA